MAEEAQILFEQAGGVVTATLNRPAKLNAITADMFSAAWLAKPFLLSKFKVYVRNS